MDRKSDKLVRRTTMVATLLASYFLLTPDYGPAPNVLDPIKGAIRSAEHRVKEFVFGPQKGIQGSDGAKLTSNSTEKNT